MTVGPGGDLGWDLPLFSLRSQEGCDSQPCQFVW